MNIQKYGLLIVAILAGIVLSGWFLYTQKINEGVVKYENVIPEKKEAMVDENIVPEWATYTHPLLGYTIEYPKNILPQMRTGDSLFDIYFYKNTPGEKPLIFISLSNSRTLSISERNKVFPSEMTKKTTISEADAYIITDSKYPNSLSVELDKGGVFYSIGVSGLPPATINHIINSFHINFVPDLQKVNLVPKSKELIMVENIVPEWASYTNASLGYTIEYPKNILSLIKLDEARSRVYFYKNTVEENPQLDVTTSPSLGSSLREWTANDKAPNTSQKIIISGVDTYLHTYREFPNSPFIQFIKDGVFYSISFGELPLPVINHIINSFRINFVPKNL